MRNTQAIADIRSQYDAEWILIDDPETDEKLQVLRGRVIAHSKNRDVVYRHAAATRPKRFAVLYTGQMPRCTAF